MEEQNFENSVAADSANFGSDAGDSSSPAHESHHGGLFTGMENIGKGLVDGVIGVVHHFEGHEAMRDEDLDQAQHHLETGIDQVDEFANRIIDHGFKG